MMAARYNDEKPEDEKQKKSKGPKKTNVPTYRDRPEEDLPKYEDEPAQG